MVSAETHAHGEHPDSPDQATPAGAVIPTPTRGVGATELATESNDPTVLRDLLDRARERLAFYESFDRIIGENIRRSGELMVETVALREQARAQAAEFAAERAAFDATRQADRDAYRALVQDALNDVAATRPVIDQLVDRLQAALVTFDNDTPDVTASAPADEIDPGRGPEAQPAQSPEAATGAEPATPAPEPGPESPSDEAEPIPEPVAEPAPVAESAPTGKRTVEVLAHGVGTAAVAISLQRTLRELDYVANVEAREFADGVLRLQVEANDEVLQTDLAGWLDTHEGHISNASGNVLEINLGSTPAT
jgi:hypothetical protein